MEQYMNVNSNTEAQEGQHGHEGFPWKHVIGFVLSLALTVGALWLVLSAPLSSTLTLVIIAALAIFQVFVQLLLFMHLNEQEKAYQTTAILFGFFVAFCIIGGSAFVMAFNKM